MTFKRILVPVDGSAPSMKGLAVAAKLAREGRGRLQLLHVVDNYPAYAVPEGAVDVGPMIEAFKAGGRKTLAACERRARSAGARAETKLLEIFGGRTADAIAGAAKRWGADLIVMGTHGRRGVQRALLGSDAEVVVRHSPVPVLLVPGAKRR
jgi:nucleotide-binding universal stress UspA family protein